MIKPVFEIKRLLHLFVAFLFLWLASPAIVVAQISPTVTLNKQVLILVSVEFGGPGIDQYVSALNNG